MYRKDWLVLLEKRFESECLVGLRFSFFFGYIVFEAFQEIFVSLSLSLLIRFVNIFGFN